MTIRFDGRVAIVTGAGQGLGRAHALALAQRGAKVVVNDLGGARDGTGACVSAADRVVEEIVSTGGEAMANAANVAHFEEVAAMVAAAKKRWGRVDILVNNAGILRDRTFAKMELDDFHAVLDVHLTGTVNCCKAAWATMREQAYGRIVNTTSSVGLYGNFGQANYAVAKMAVVGLMNALHVEGQKYNIRINCLAPCGNTRMTQDLLTEDVLALAAPEAVSPGVMFLVGENAPSRVILDAGCGGFARTFITETNGIMLSEADNTPECIAARWDEISNRHGELTPEHCGFQLQKFADKAASLRADQH